MLLISLAHNLALLYIFFFLGGVAGALPANGYYAMFTYCPRCYQEMGTAIGVAMAGRGIGSIAIQPLVVFLPDYGWQATYICAGSLFPGFNVPLIRLN